MRASGDKDDVDDEFGCGDDGGGEPPVAVPRGLVLTETALVIVIVRRCRCLRRLRDDVVDAKGRAEAQKEEETGGASADIAVVVVVVVAVAAAAAERRSIVAARESGTL